jgi:hypothetical protein
MQQLSYLTTRSGFPLISLLASRSLNVLRSLVVLLRKAEFREAQIAECLGRRTQRLSSSGIVTVRCLLGIAGSKEVECTSHGSFRVLL